MKYKTWNKKQKTKRKKKPTRISYLNIPNSVQTPSILITN